MNALQDIHVVDFSKVLAGPLCAQCLGDLGADVIKVEPVEHGDDSRRMPPFRNGEDTIYLSTNWRLKTRNTLTQRNTHPWRLKSTSAQT